MKKILKRRKKISLLLLPVMVLLLAIGGCLKSAPSAPFPALKPQEVKITIEVQNKDGTTVEVKDPDTIIRTMSIPNQDAIVSSNTWIHGDEAFTEIFSSITLHDVKRLWSDFMILKKTTSIRKIHLFISSPGGGAFTGLALTDQIERAQKEGFHITAHASGIIASAAVPVFAACDKRYAASGCVFMVHETSIWKWPGSESHSDIKSQTRLLDLLRDKYLGKLAAHTELTVEQWGEMEGKTTWFSVEKALEYGLVDEVR